MLQSQLVPAGAMLLYCFDREVYCRCRELLWLFHRTLLLCCTSTPGALLLARQCGPAARVLGFGMASSLLDALRFCTGVFFPFSLLTPGFLL